MTKSQACPLYSRDQGAATNASEADWKPFCIRVNIICHVYFSFKNVLLLTRNVVLEIKEADRGRNSIFGRISTEREYLFFSKPNNLKCVHLGCKGAKDANQPQDDLEKERMASDEVTSLSSLFSRPRCSKINVRRLKTFLLHSVLQPYKLPK